MWIKTKRDGLINLDFIENILIESTETASGDTVYEIRAIGMHQEHIENVYKLFRFNTKSQAEQVLSMIYNRISAPGTMCVDLTDLELLGKKDVKEIVSSIGPFTEAK